MERSAIVGFIVTVIVALFLISGYFIYKATQNPTPPTAPTQAKAPVSTPATTGKKPPAPKPVPPSQKPPLVVDEPKFMPPTEMDPEAVIKMAREVQGGGSAVPGKTLDITLTLEKEGMKPIRALGIQELLPKGWTFDSVVSEVKPDLIPPKGRTPTVEFVWFNIPEFPLQLTYRVKVADNFNVPGEIKGQTLYRADGGELRTEVIVSPVVPGGTPAVSVSAQPGEEKSDERQPDAPPTEQKPKTASATSTGANTSKSPSPARMILKREINPKQYSPGGKLEVTVIMEYSGSDEVTALGLVEYLPDGFKFERVIDGAIPTVKPKQGDTLLQFAWVNIPEFPAQFKYELSVDSSASGDKSISGQVLFHTTGPQRQSPRVVSKIYQAKQN